MVLTELELGTFKVRVPYTITHTIEDPKNTPTGYSVQQRKGFLFTKKMLELRYENLTLTEKDNLTDPFGLPNPYIIFTILLFNLHTYKLAKPIGYKLETFNAIEAGLLVKKYNVTFSCRILQ